MAFKKLVAELANGLGAQIEIADDACAVELETEEGVEVTILMQGFDERGVMLTTADLGEPPPEGREGLFLMLLATNDAFERTCGATLSVNPATGRIRLQRHDTYDALAYVGAAKALIAFANVAATWKRVVADFRVSAQRPSGEGMVAVGGAPFGHGDAIFV